MHVDCRDVRGHIQFIDSVENMEDFSIFGCFLPIPISLTPGCERLFYFIRLGNWFAVEREYKYRQTAIKWVNKCVLMLLRVRVP